MRFTKYNNPSKRRKSRKPMSFDMEMQRVSEALLQDRLLDDKIRRIREEQEMQNRGGIMPDYEDMILARQEEREILEDECDGNCDYCKYASPILIGYYPDGSPRYAMTQALNGEYYYRCTLTEDEDD